MKKGVLVYNTTPFVSGLSTLNVFFKIGAFLGGNPRKYVQALNVSVLAEKYKFAVDDSFGAAEHLNEFEVVILAPTVRGIKKAKLTGQIIQLTSQQFYANDIKNVISKIGGKHDRQRSVNQ